MIYGQPDSISIIASRRMDAAVATILFVSVMAVMVSCHQVCFIGSEYNPQSGIPPRWFLPYKDLCECTALRLGGMRIPASSYSQGAAFYLNELFLSEDSEEMQAYFKCSHLTTVPTLKTTTVPTAECESPGPLGMEDKTIPNSHISASSIEDCCPASKGRLHGDKAWQTKSPQNSWMEVQLVQSSVVTGVTTQGYSSWYVKKYKFVYKKQPSSSYEYVTDGNGNIKVFNGNTEDCAPVTNHFDDSVVATVVRIEPTEWYDGVAMRLELLGCPI